MSVARTLLLASLGAASLTATAPDQSTIAQVKSQPNEANCPPLPDESRESAMRFTVREIDGQRVLLAEGAIDDDLVPRLQSAIDSFEGGEIWLQSAGGNGRVARQAGIIIRHGGLSTRIRANTVCAGACNYMFLGGIIRTVESGGYYMVTESTSISDHDHIQIAREEDPSARISAIPGTTALSVAEENEFLIHMGVSRALLTEISLGQHTGPGSARRYCLTRNELERYNVAPVAFRFDDASRAKEATKP